MLIKDCWNIILSCQWSAYPVSLFPGVYHARLHSGSDDGKLQFCEYSRHLNEGLAHGVNVASATINGDASNNHQAHMLALDDIHDFAKLLCASGQARDLSA